jgi:hypothetical protein
MEACRGASGDAIDMNIPVGTLGTCTRSEGARAFTFARLQSPLELR